MVKSVFREMYGSVQPPGDTWRRVESRAWAAPDECFFRAQIIGNANSMIFLGFNANLHDLSWTECQGSRPGCFYWMNIATGATQW